MMIIIIGVWASWLMAQTLDVPSMLEFEFETEEKLKKNDEIIPHYMSSTREKTQIKCV